MEASSVAETVADTIEEVSEHMDEVADATRSLMGRDIRFLIVGGVIGLAGGAAAGYYLTKGKLNTKYQQLLEDELDEMRLYYSQREVAREPKPELDKVVKDLGYVSPETERSNQSHPALVSQEGDEGSAAEEVVEVTENVFTKVVEDAPAEWDLETEKNLRSNDAPYIIHVDEYRENEHSFDQVTYTYYEEDDVLADVRDHIVDDVDGLIGLHHLQKFGAGSNDASIVYIRNPKLELDFEVVRNPGNFGEQVHGFIKHSDDSSRRRKARFDDGTSRG